VTNSLIKMMTT